jgi:hypothetical protein
LEDAGTVDTIMIRRFLFLSVATVLATSVSGGLWAQTITATGSSIAGLRTGFVTGDASAFQLLAPSALSQPQTFKSTMVIGEKPLSFPWKKDITTTVFWIGESPSGGNATPNVGSSWDPNWMWHYGGVDDPEPTRRAVGYRPAAFVPKQNPFYFALPYNDCYDNRSTKAQAARVVPWFKTTFKKVGKSVCRNRWIAIRHGEKECYAQWSDCGPFSTEDANYVFGNARPANGSNGGAGLDVAPAVRDYLSMKSGAQCDWRFVEVDEVPDGPWKTFGTNNPFSKQWNGGADDESPPPVAAQVVMARLSAAPSVRQSPTLPAFKLKSVSR